jgi:hypothetical protein
MAVLIAITSRLNSDAVAHGGHAAGELGHRTDFARRQLDQLREALERPMRREHVVIRRNDSKIRPTQAAQRLLVLLVHGRKAMRKIGTRQARARRLILPLRFAHALQIGATGGLAALANPLGHGAHTFVQGCAGFHRCCIL